MVTNDTPFALKPPAFLADIPWPQIGGSPAVFIAQWEIRADDPDVPEEFQDTDVYLFGRRLPKPDQPQPALAVEYVVLELSLGQATLTEHRLSQHNTVAYCDADDPARCETVDLMSKQDYRTLWRKPRWDTTQASWPLHDNQPMLFLGQVLLPQNEVTETLLGQWLVYLFVESVSDGELKFAITTIDADEQTAEEHARAEELIAKFEKNRSSEAVITECVKKGDRYVHEFIVEHPGVTDRALILLEKQGKNKSIRTAAKKKLQEREE